MGTLHTTTITPRSTSTTGVRLVDTTVVRVTIIIHLDSIEEAVSDSADIVPSGADADKV